MKFNQTLAALLLVSAGALSTQVSAHESAVEKIVGNIVSNAMSKVSVELDQQVEKITLSASNLMSYDGSEAPTGNVAITDLASNDSDADTTSINAENDSRKADTDDE